MASNKRLVTVYDKNGKSYTVSHLNAHDMVSQLGYTYVPGKKFTPVDHVPFQPASVPKTVEAKHIQSIIDGVGTDSSMMGAAEEHAEAMPMVFDAAAVSKGPREDTDLPVMDEAADDEPMFAADAEELPAFAEDVEELPAAGEGEEAPKRRGRPPKASA